MKIDLESILAPYALVIGNNTILGCVSEINTETMVGVTIEYSENEKPISRVVVADEIKFRNDMLENLKATLPADTKYI